MSSVSKRRKEGSRAKIKSMGDHKEFLKRITKTLYYGQLPTLPCLSLPVTEISCEVWSVSQRGRSLRRLHADAAAGIARSACVSPCALVLAILYLERLHTSNPEYLAATPPADLFLVSLMVGNKFLQDDGEDDEVICSEWAASGGIDLKQLRKLELEFLSAIDWNVFVSEKSFEAGLKWLERQVALRQAQARGFFTYADLAAATSAGAGSGSGSGSGSGALLGAVARAAAAYAASLAALLALVASALLLSRAAAALRPHAPRAPDTTRANIITHNVPSEVTLADNATDPLAAAGIFLDEADAAEKLRCCTGWFRYQETATARKTWSENIVLYDWRSLEPWWSTTPVLNWLYQSSLINPMQRWLEKINEWSALVRREARASATPRRQCGRQCGRRRDAQPRCVRQWLDLSKLNAMAAAVSDR